MQVELPEGAVERVVVTTSKVPHDARAIVDREGVNPPLQQVPHGHKEVGSGSTRELVARLVRAARRPVSAIAWLKYSRGNKIRTPWRRGPSATSYSACRLGQGSEIQDPLIDVAGAVINRLGALPGSAGEVIALPYRP